MTSIMNPAAVNCLNQRPSFLPADADITEDFFGWLKAALNYLQRYPLTRTQKLVLLSAPKCCYIMFDCWLTTSFCWYFVGLTLEEDVGRILLVYQEPHSHWVLEHDRLALAAQASHMSFCRFTWSRGGELVQDACGCSETSTPESQAARFGFCEVCLLSRLIAAFKRAPGWQPTKMDAL